LRSTTEAAAPDQTKACTLEAVAVPKPSPTCSTEFVASASDCVKLVGFKLTALPAVPSRGARFGLNNVDVP